MPGEGYSAELYTLDLQASSANLLLQSPSPSMQAFCHRDTDYAKTKP